MKNKKWYMPSYYKNFSCKADKCRHSCCSMWKIPITESEYFKLIGMECSEELHKRIEYSFSDPKTPDEKCYKYISYNWLGDCPMNKDGLCMLHAEKGIDNLPAVCKLYPRSLKTINEINIACCSSSCEKVIEMLFEENDLDFKEEYLDATAQIEYELDDDVISYLLQINNILKNTNMSLNERIKDICLLVNPIDFIKEYSKDLEPLEEAISLLNRFSNSDNFLADISKEVIARYHNKVEQYALDSKKFEENYPNWSTFFENVINNSLIYEAFPFVDNRFDKTNAFKGLCATYGLLKVIAIGYTSIHEGKDNLIDVVSELFHLIDHTAFYYNVNVVCNNAAILLKL